MMKRRVDPLVRAFSMVLLLSSSACGVAPSSDACQQGLERFTRACLLESTSAAASTYSPKSVAKITAGQYHSCAIDTDGRLYCWGKNHAGQLGDDSTTDRTRPVLIDPDERYTSVSAGSTRTCGITQSGVLKCWGARGGHLGDGIASTTPAKTPVVIDSGTSYSMVSVGHHSACGITSTGALKCWGSGSWGMQGNGSTSSRTLPQETDSGVLYSWVSLTYYHACGVTVVGDVKCWGENSHGQSHPDAVGSNALLPTLISNLPASVRVSVGFRFSCALSGAGEIRCWGESSGYQLGRGSNVVNPESPGLLSVSGVATSLSSRLIHSLALLSDGSLIGWGNNAGHKLSASSTTSSYQSPGAVLSDLRFSMVATGQDHSCAIATDDTPYCWGSNATGQIGDGSRTNPNRPVEITFPEIE